MDIHMHVLVKPCVQSKPVACVYIVYFKVQEYYKLRGPRLSPPQFCGNRYISLSSFRSGTSLHKVRRGRI